MKNKDMPASPILGDTEAFISFLEGIKGGNNYGLTKREYAAIHNCAALLSQNDTSMTGTEIIEIAILFADQLFHALEETRGDDA